MKIDEQQIAVLIDLAKQATAKKCVEIVRGKMAIQTGYMTRDDRKHTESLQRVIDAISEKFGLEI